MIKIISRKDCSGCFACANICPKQCISMQSDNEGFWNPVVDEAVCIQCGLCDKICPMLNTKMKDADKRPKAYAVQNKDENIRMQSSSGGVFSLLADNIIEREGVVFGAAFTDNFLVHHIVVDNKDDLKKLRGSKYLQSRIGDTYKMVKVYLDKRRLVMFTGTPCQIGGLKSYLQKDYENLICQDVICHGVSSPKVWEKYIAYRESCAGSPVRRIAFRQKNEGWKRYSVSFLFNNDTEYHQTLDKDLMMTAFLNNVCLRLSCYDCSFKTMNRESDITLADFWGIQNIMPEMDDDKGTSLLILNSIKGENLFEFVKDKSIYKSADINSAVKFNPSMISSVAYNQKREGFFNDIDSIGFDKLVNKYCRDGVWVSCKKKIRNILSKIKYHLLKNK